MRPSSGPSSVAARVSITLRPAGAATVSHRLSTVLADPSMRRLNPIAEALMRVLELAQSRLSVDDVMGLLSLEVLQRRFGFQPSDLEDIQRIFDESTIRWGIDARIAPAKSSRLTAPSPGKKASPSLHSARP